MERSGRVIQLFGVVHRLDVGTTGLMVVAKSERAYTLLKLAFKERTVPVDEGSLAAYGITRQLTVNARAAGPRIGKQMRRGLSNPERGAGDKDGFARNGRTETPGAGTSRGREQDAGKERHRSLGGYSQDPGKSPLRSLRTSRDALTLNLGTRASAS